MTKRRSSVRTGEISAYPVKLRKSGLTLPYFDVSYEYVGESLPAVGETILLRRSIDSRGEELGDVYGYVTRIDAAATTPISATETVRPESADDDYVVA